METNASAIKSKCPLRPSEIENKVAHNEKSKFFIFRPMVGLEMWWDFFLEKSFKPAKNLQNHCGPICLQKHAK